MSYKIGKDDLFLAMITGALIGALIARTLVGSDYRTRAVVNGCAEYTCNNLGNCEFAWTGGEEDNGH